MTELCERVKIHEHGSSGRGRSYDAWRNENYEIYEITPKVAVKKAIVNLSLERNTVYAVMYDAETGALINEWNRNYPTKWKRASSMSNARNAVDEILYHHGYNEVEYEELSDDVGI
jgi:hypothetical protein